MIFGGLLILGVGRTMPYSLGLPLIDDNVRRRNLPLYFGPFQLFVFLCAFANYWKIVLDCLLVSVLSVSDMILIGFDTEVIDCLAHSHKVDNFELYDIKVSSAFSC